MLYRNEKYGIELQYLTAKLKNSARKVKEVVKSVKNSADDNSIITPSIDTSKIKKQYDIVKKFNSWSTIKSIPENQVFNVGNKNYIKNVKKEMDNVNTSTNTAKSSFKKLNDNIKNTFNKGVQSVKRFSLSLFGIQSIWRTLSKATSSYLSYDTELSQKIKNNWTSLGALLEPILSFITNCISKVIGYINVFIKALTGTDYITKASNKAINSIKKNTKATKELNKELTILDEITNLPTEQILPDEKIDNPFAELTTIKLNPEIVKWTETIAEKLKNVWDWCMKNKKLLKELAIVGAGAFIGWKIGSAIGGIAKLLGVAGGSTGLYGLIGALAVIELIGVKKLIDQIMELSDLLAEIEERYNDRMTKREETLDSIIKQLEDSETTQDRINQLVASAEGEYKTYLDDLKDGVNYTEEQRDKIDKMVSKIESISGRKFKTSIEAEMEIKPTPKSANNIGTWFNNVLSGFNNWLDDLFGVPKSPKVNGFATGTVAYKPTFGQFGEYSGASSNPEIVSPRNIMKETFTESMLDILPHIQSNNEPKGDVVLEINGRELARATISDFEEEGVRLGKTSVIRRQS